MTDRTPLPWTTLAADTLPTKRLCLHGFDRDPRALLVGRSWAPLVPVDASNSARQDMDFARTTWLCDPHSAPSLRAGVNHYGLHLLARVTADEVELTCSTTDDLLADEVAASTRLLAFLAREARLEFRWQAFSFYEDTGESRDHVEGDAAELIARLALA